MAAAVTVSRPISLILGASVFALIALTPLIGGAYVISLVFSALIAFVLAQSWDWIGGEAGYVNLGHFVFYGLGAYVFSILLVRHVPLPLCFALAGIIVAVIATALAFPLFRLQGDYFAFATLTLLPLAELMAFNLTPLTGGADGIVLPPHYVLVPALLLATALSAITVFATGELTRSRFGYALKSIRNDELAAEVVGVWIFSAKLKVLVLSASFAALAGGIHAWQLSYIDPPTVFGLNLALVPVAMALLGGTGMRWGPLVGVILLFTLQQWLLVNVTMLQATIYGLVILLIGRFMPGGLLRARVVQLIPLLRALAREHHESSEKGARSQDVATRGLPLPKSTLKSAQPLLECRDLTMAFGGNVAVNHVNLSVRQGEIIGLVGANGSGKTTLFNCISKVYEPNGVLIFDGHSLSGLRRDEVSRLGVGRTFQIPRPFGDLTVAENIAIALTNRAEPVSMSEALSGGADFAAFVGLGGHLSSRADALTLQQKKSLELARALALKPKLLLVDEVASGLTPAEVKRFVSHIRTLRDHYGMTVIWVEHIFSALTEVVDRLVVLEQGSVIADAPLAEAVRDERVLKSYLGSAPTGAA
jgi:branched-chain amino acid transport system permease protein